MTEPETHPSNFVAPAEWAPPGAYVTTPAWTSEPPTYAAPVKKKPSKAPWVIFSIAVLTIVIWVSTANPDAPAPAKTTTSSPAAALVLPPTPVIYSITGTATSFSVTMEAPTGTVQKDVGPGTVASYFFDAGDFVYLSAQNQGDSGTVTCTITEDGLVISTNTSSGAYVIAQCDGQAF